MFFRTEPDMKLTEMVFRQKQKILLLTDEFGKSLFEDYDLLKKLKVSYGQKNRNKVKELENNNISIGYKLYPLTKKEYDYINSSPILSGKLEVHCGSVGLQNDKKSFITTVIINDKDYEKEDQAYMYANRILSYISSDLKIYAGAISSIIHENQQHKVVNVFPYDYVFQHKDNYSWFSTVRKMYKEFRG